jgi:predicted TIM-barrel fold metal-dependent hydrolase
MDMEYRQSRVDKPPTLARLPSEYVHERVRFTTQPLEMPGDAGAMVDLLTMVDGQRLLMFSSGRPLWRDNDTGPKLAAALPAAWRRPIFHDNARSFFQRDSTPAPAEAPARRKP